MNCHNYRTGLPFVNPQSIAFPQSPIHLAILLDL